jgi:hypothetical protein
MFTPFFVNSTEHPTELQPPLAGFTSARSGCTPKASIPIKADMLAEAANRLLLNLGLELDSSLQLVFIAFAPFIMW